MKTLAAAVVAGALALVGLVVRADLAVRPEGRVQEPYAPAFRDATAGPPVVMNTHDGQAFGSLALDPLLSRPQEWSGGRATMAYRATRPLLGWLVALTSFGSTAVAAWSLLAWTAVGIGLLVGAAAALRRRWGRDPDQAVLLLLLPGVVGLVRFGGLSDGLATGLSLLGLAWWLDGGPGDRGRDRDRGAIILLCLAALCRESALVVPAALLLAGGPGWGGGDSRRPRLGLLWPFALYLGWVVVVGLRLGVAPTDPSQGRLAFPLIGLIAGVRSWTWVGAVCAVSVVVTMAIAYRRAPCADVRWLVIVSALFALVLGEGVWRSWDFARTLLPVTVVGVCLAGRRLLDRDAVRQLEVEQVGAH